MAIADYIHRLEFPDSRSVIVIEDLNIGGTSVKNDIENVVREIGVVENIDLADYMVVYKDSDGTWDGYEYSSESFVSLGGESWEDACDKYIQKQLLQA